MATSSTESAVPRQVLLAFFLEATNALKTLNAPDPVSLPECQSLLLEQQRSCLERVVTEHNATHGTQLDTATVQDALSQTSDHPEEALQQSMESMNDAARLAFARLVLSSECQRTATTSFNKIDNHHQYTNEAVRTDPLQTSRMTRSAMLEFCALGVAATRLENVRAHLRDSEQPLLLTSNDGTTSNNSSDNNNNNNNNNSQESFTPPMKRLENLQRLLLQAIGYDPEMGLKELARQVQMEGNDDVELVQVIRQATASMMEAVLGSNGSGHNTSSQDPRRQPELLLSDQDQGGVTRVVSVQHSETMVQIVNSEEGGAAQVVGASGATAAPVSQSMREESNNNHSNSSTNSNNQEQLQLAREAEHLRRSLVQELRGMSEGDRSALLQNAEQALQDFQQRALQRSPGHDRIDFLRNMDARTKKLLTMHRIWQEEQAASD